MMILEMDQKSAPSSREQDQCLRKNIESVKRNKGAQLRVPSDPNTWQQTREKYEAILLQDHAFSEQQSVEYALWQLHYKRIEEFRRHLSVNLSAKSSSTLNRKSHFLSDRITKLLPQFKAFLSEATGFYHDLIMKIRAKHGLSLGCFSENLEKQINMDRDGTKSVEMKKGLVSCHRCLVYLGDLARYKGLYADGDSRRCDFEAALSYYLQAASLWPLSGNPHHQLAVLATYSEDEFVSVYRYFRSIAVAAPSSTARDNLVVEFEKNRQNYKQLQEDIKASSVNDIRGRRKIAIKYKPKETDVSLNPARKEDTKIRHTYKTFSVQFVRLNGLLFTRTSLETFGEVLSLVSNALSELLFCGPEEVLNFGKDTMENGLVIVRLISMLIFSVHNVNRENEGQTYADIVQRAVLYQNSLVAVFELGGHILRRCVLLHDPSSSYLLPGILVMMEWLASSPDVAEGGNLDDKQATIRSNFWNHCTSLLNRILSTGLVSIDDEDETCFSDVCGYEMVESHNCLALWEDFELRGFLPLQPAQTILDFSRLNSFGIDNSKEKIARIKRILTAGKALAIASRVEQKAMHFNSQLKQFVTDLESPKAEDIKLIDSIGYPKSTGGNRETSVDLPRKLPVMNTKAVLSVEGEDDDEVIVFRPTVNERRSNLFDHELKPDNGIELDQNEFGDAASIIQESIMPPESICPQISVDSGSKLSLPFDNHTQLHLNSNQSFSSVWPVDQDVLANGLKHICLVDNKHIPNPRMQIGGDTLHPCSLSLPTHQSVYTNTNGISYSQTIGERLKSRFDLCDSGCDPIIPPIVDIISSTGSSRDTLVEKTSSRQSLVNRPMRHLGPPPGFGPIHSTQVDMHTSELDVEGLSPLTDDYSWLDGYELKPSTKKPSGNKIMNHMIHPSPLYARNDDSYVRMISFPFPGEQAAPIQSEMKMHKGRENHLTLENVKMPHEQVQQLHPVEEYQEFLPMLEKYKGQSIWESYQFV